MDSVQADKNYLQKSTLYTLVGTALKVVAPVLTIVLARVFGKEIFGIYVSTQLLVMTLARISIIGLDKGLLRHLPQNKVCGRSPHEGVIESLRLATLISFLISSIIWVGAYFGLQSVSTGLAMLSSVEISLYALSIVPYTILLLFAGASDGNRHPQYKIFINEFVVMTLAPIIALCLHFLGFVDQYALPVGFFASNMLGVFVYIFLINKQFPEIKWFTKNKLPSELLNFSIPIGFSEIVASFLLRIDMWMVLAILGPEAVGIYAVMVTVSNGLKTIRNSYDPILQPVVAGMTLDRLKTDLKPVFSYCVSMVTIIQLAIGFFIVLFPEQTMMIAGKSFITKENPVAVFGILIIGNLINGFLGMSASVVMGLGKSKFMLMMNVVSLVFAVTMNSICIPLFGIAGAALSCMSYQILQCTWMNLYLRKMGFWPYKMSLLVQVAWIVAIIVIYIALNTVVSATLLEKGVAYGIVILLLLLTFWKQGLAKKNF